MVCERTQDESESPPTSDDESSEDEDQTSDSETGNAVEDTPAPLEGGEGGHLQAGDSVCQHSAGVSAPT